MSRSRSFFVCVAVACVSVLSMSALVSCRCGGTRAGGGVSENPPGSAAMALDEAVPEVSGQPVPFPFIEAPLMVQQQGPVAVAEYLCGHFWNDYLDTSRIFPDSDTLFLGVTRAALKDAVRNFA